MSEDFDNLIAKEQEELKSVKSKMEDARQQFIKDSTNFVMKWYEDTAQRYAKKDADITLALGVDKVKQMKAKILDLQKNAEKITNEFLNDSDLWWHLKESKNSWYIQIGNRPPKALDKAIRLILGRLGSILEEFGYDVTTKASRRTDMDIWVEWDPSGRYHPPTGRPYYPSGQEWSQEMRSTIEQYSELFEKAKELQSETNRLITAKKMKQAQDLWDTT